MARARSNGGAYAWALVVFGCGFVVALLVAIIFYTKIKQAEEGRVDAENELATYVNKSQDVEDLQPWVGDENRGNKSAFRLMQEEIEQYRSDVSAWQNQIDGLNAQRAEAEATIEREREKLDQREQALLDQQAASAAALAEAENQARQTEARLQAVSQERAELQQMITSGLTDANDLAQRQIAQLNEERDALTQELGDNERVMEVLRDRVRELEQLKKELIIPEVTTADGEILSVFNNGNQLFINRGRNQGIMLGLTFEVFDASEVISLSEIGAPRGKATIEVYDLQDDTAACRVVRRQRGGQVVAGDVIANIVYDPNMVYTFYVYGEFDIEFDGGGNDLGRIRNLVTEWGGLLAELQEDEDGLPVLSPQIDFLVLGNEPLFPDPLPEGTLDPEAIAAWQAKVEAFESYQALLDDAKKLGIPVLNQNRFIDLVGYYER